MFVLISSCIPIPPPVLKHTNMHIELYCMCHTYTHPYMHTHVHIHTHTCTHTQKKISKSCQLKVDNFNFTEEGYQILLSTIIHQGGCLSLQEAHRTSNILIIKNELIYEGRETNPLTVCQQTMEGK